MATLEEVFDFLLETANAIPDQHGVSPSTEAAAFMAGFHRGLLLGVSRPLEAERLLRHIEGVAPNFPNQRRWVDQVAVAIEAGVDYAPDGTFRRPN